jgi:glucosamine-6-phosphate deaminase
LLLPDRGALAVRVPPTVFADSGALGRALATEIADGIELAARQGRPYVLGCPGGRSPQTTYAALADEVTARAADLRHVVIVMMDDYVVPDGPGRFRRVDADLPYSCERFGRVEIAGRLNAAAGAGRGITADRLWVPDPADPGAYDERITGTGGVDLFVLASGAGDGHVAFNPPGTAATTRTRVVALAESTRRDNLATFPSFGGVDDVPRHGVTVGIATLREQSRRAVMIAHGAGKAEAARHLVAAEGYDPDWPATVVGECARPALYLDEAAARS